MTSDAAHGTMTAHRTKRRPQKSLDEELRQPRLTSDGQHDDGDHPDHGVGQDRAEVAVAEHLAVVAQPASPLRRPVMEYRASEAWTSSIAG